MSSEKRAESCLKIPQSPQKRFVQIRVIRGTSFAFFASLREIILLDEKVFISLLPNLETNLKKEETANKKIHYNDLVF